MNSEFAYEETENSIKLYRGEDCVEVFCDYISIEARRLYHMFPEKPMEPLTHEQWRKFNRATNIASKDFRKIIPRLEITATTQDYIEDLSIVSVI